MNAYELADELQDVIGLKNKPENPFSVMLRQQADQIESLLSFIQHKGIAGQWIVYGANEAVRKANK